MSREPDPAADAPDEEHWRRRPLVLSVVAGRRLGETFLVPGRQVTVGRAKGSDILIPDHGISRVHVALRRDDLGNAQLTDLESTNGTWVEGKRVRRHTVRDGDRVQVGNNTVLELHYLADSDEARAYMDYQRAIRDPGTGAFAKPYLLDRLGQALVDARRGSGEVALMLLGADPQEALTADSAGAWQHLGRPLAELLTRRLRHADLLALYRRWNFAVLVRGVRPGQARRIAERLLRAVREGPLPTEGPAPPLTLSAGIATYRQGDGQDPSQLLLEAEGQLLDAQTSGGDTIRGAPAPPPS
jgi:diguanylate cyclase (GGDEF)-like protein